MLSLKVSMRCRHYDYARMRDIADKSNAYLLSDMAHISGLVAAGALLGSSVHALSAALTLASLRCRICLSGSQH